MREVTGNYWDYAPQHHILCVTTNGQIKRNGRLVMGAGIAKQFAERFPHLPFHFGSWVRSMGNQPCMVEVIDPPRKNGYLACSFPTKNHWRDASIPELIRTSALLIRRRADEMRAARILSTRPGCGHGKLKWKDVKPLLKEAGWDDRFTIVSPR